MIVRLRMEIQDKIGNDVNYYFDTIDTHRPYAMALNAIMLAIALLVAAVIFTIGRRRRKGETP